MMNWIVYICAIQLLLLIFYTDCSKASKRAIRYSSSCPADAKEHWSYRGYNGPEHWGQSYPGCNGREQSPIAISSYHAVRNANLVKLQFLNYNAPVSRATIQNNGHTVQININDGVQRSIYVNGQRYTLVQLHFHWGDSYNRGAEHTLNGVRYALEMHLVHRNANNQLAVVAVFFQEQSQTTRELQTIISQFPEVLYKDSTVPLRARLNLGNLLPSNPSSFYRYSGSLTTPGCNEGVTWSVLPKSLPVGRQQMAEFRKLYSATRSNASPGCKISNNYRPVQRLNHRTVFISQ